MILVRLRALPPTSATKRAMGNPGWRLEHYLIADLYHASTGKPHPLLPAPVAVPDRAREERKRDAKRRARERQRRIDAGEIT